MQCKFSHPDERIMDNFTKKVLYTADVLLNSDFSQLNQEKTGVVLITGNGIYKSLKEIADAIRENGYKGINPSFFPNVMLSTALARLAILCQVHGPSCAFYDEKADKNDAMEYCKLQIQAGNSEAMILISADEEGNSEGYFIQGEV